MGIVVIDGVKYIERLNVIPQEVSITTNGQIIAPARIVLPGIAQFLMKGLTRDTLVNGVQSVVITVPGSGYGAGTLLTIGAPNIAGGTQATATPILSGGALIGAVVTNPGSGYTAVPPVTVSGGGGTLATAIATIGGTSVRMPFKFKLGNSDGALWYFQGGSGGTTDRVLDSLCFGNGQFPYPVFPPIPYGANSTINYEFEDVSMQAPYTAYLAFHGTYLIPLPQGS